MTTNVLIANECWAEPNPPPFDFTEGALYGPIPDCNDLQKAASSGDQNATIHWYTSKWNDKKAYLWESSIGTDYASMASIASLDPTNAINLTFGCVDDTGTGGTTTTTTTTTTATKDKPHCKPPSVLFIVTSATFGVMLELIFETTYPEFSRTIAGFWTKVVIESAVSYLLCLALPQ